VNAKTWLTAMKDNRSAHEGVPRKQRAGGEQLRNCSKALLAFDTIEEDQRTTN